MFALSSRVVSCVVLSCLVAACRVVSCLVLSDVSYLDSLPPSPCADSREELKMETHDFFMDAKLKYEQAKAN